VTRRLGTSALKKLTFTCLVFLLAQMAMPPLAVAGEASAEQSALAFQGDRFQAMVDADVKALEGMLAEELNYGHTTGWTETKQQFLATVGSGKLDYLSITPAEVRVRIYGNVAVMTGLADLRGRLDDREVSISIRFLDVSRQYGDTWQLVAWQSVRLPDEE